MDGYRWLHGVAIVRHAGTLFASWGHNRGDENTATEIAQARRSKTNGESWEPVELVSSGGPDHAVSHGVFLSRENELWLFCGRFQGKRKNTVMEAFRLDSATDRWASQGVVAGNAFWPMAEPQKMTDGNWIIAGFQVDPPHAPAVAISHGDDMTRWDVILIPLTRGLGEIWGESSVIVEGSRLLCIARYGEKAVALASESNDFGRHWSNLSETNLPMAPSKPYAGILSTGHRYVIGNTTRDCGHRRDPLTIALSKPGETEFSTVKVIRRGKLAESNDPVGTKLAYPYAKEYDGNLYVGYSVGHLPANQNHAELAVIPLTELTR